MNAGALRRCFALVLATWLLVALPAGADPAKGGYSEYGIEDDENRMALTWLSVALHDYANAMAAWLSDAMAGSHDVLSDGALDRFQQQMLRATFAYFEYTYEVNGVSYSRIYLAASGRNFASYIVPGSIGLAPPSRPDASYFLDDGVIRHATAGPVEGSNVTPRPPAPKLANRGNDAEIKALQSIKRDLDAGLVQPGGRLLGFISSRPCDSCHPALRKFSEETGADVHVNYISGENSPGRQTPAWWWLRRAREAVINEIATLFQRQRLTDPRLPESPSDEVMPVTTCSKQQD